MEIETAGEFILFKRKRLGVEKAVGQANSNLIQQHPTP